MSLRRRPTLVNTEEQLDCKGRCYTPCMCNYWQRETRAPPLTLTCNCSTLCKHEEDWCQKTSCASNCRLIQCTNYWHCGASRPEYRTWDFHDDLCVTCARSVCHVERDNMRGVCSICPPGSAPIELVKADCGCHLCFMCLLKQGITASNDYMPMKCPVCDKKLNTINDEYTKTEARSCLDFENRIGYDIPGGEAVGSLWTLTMKTRYTPS